jgi:hypothetical protein
MRGATDRRDSVRGVNEKLLWARCAQQLERYRFVALAWPEAAKSTLGPGIRIEPKCEYSL